jgi:hypothetical protein
MYDAWLSSAKADALLLFRLCCGLDEAHGRERAELRADL